MASEHQSADLVDPLHGHSGLSLFPRTFRDSVNALKANDPDDIESIHNYMKSMALRSPYKLLEQANVIIDGGSALLNSNLASFDASKNKNETVAAKGKENPLERRPALGRKRARFSLKPNASQPSVSLLPSLDTSQLQDPEQFFLAYEKHENAKKELERQMGGVMTDLNEYNPSKIARCRRPGILEKSVSYRHLYPSGLSENDDTFISSQGTLEQDILSPSNYISQQETTDPNVELQERELSGSIAKTENRINELLDELLSSNCESLDEDGALSFLQERLNIKPIDLDKLCLPDLYDIGRNDFMALGKELPKPQNTLLDVHNLVKDMRRTHVKHKQVVESPVHSLASPTPPKSPFASISLLKKRILQSNLSSNPFSDLNVDLSPVRNHSSVEHIDEQSDQVDSRELRVSEKLRSLVTEKDNITVGNTGASVVITGDSVCPFDKSANDNSSRLGISIDVRSSGSLGDLEDNIMSSNIKGIDVRSYGSHGDLEYGNGGSNIDEMLMDDNVCRPITGTDVLREGPDEMEHVADMPQEASSSAQPDIIVEDSTGPYNDFQTYEHNKIGEKVEDIPQKAVSSALPDINIKDSTLEKLSCSQSQLDQSSPATVEHDAMDGASRTPDIGPEQHIEKIQEPSGIAQHEQSKAKRRPREGRKRKTLSYGQSLAAAGTFWESGIRRSSRIKMRPLEYWKGERFLYGRIHETIACLYQLKGCPPFFPSHWMSLPLMQDSAPGLTTVIGVKYVSPEKGDGKPTIRVKSYVSDEYKELVELAALH